ncbi:MAG: ABC transporter substrate-binding protein [Geminicoccaceae bacterium]|nr:MAG: ABC transporter substrate-binding protein [Geminicoccaceae bacterium]
MRRWGIWAVALAVAGGTATAAELRIGVRTGGESMDPHASGVGSNIAAVKNVFESLVALDDNLQPSPGLATSWTLIEPTTWRVELRPDVVFHDGSSFDAADVVHSLDRIRTTAPVDGGLVPFLRRIASIEVVDALTVDIHTDGPTASLPQDLGRLLIVPSETPMDASPADFNSGRLAIGTGPFRLVSFEPRGDMVLEPFPDYWGTGSTWERVTFSEITNDSARVAALLSGRVDLINAVPASAVERLRGTSGLELFESSGIFNFFLFPDYREPSPTITDNAGQPLATNPFRDPRVRQALSLAVNREGLASRVLEGTATSANQFLTPGFLGFVDDLPPLAHDVDQARALLAEAGFPDGFRVDLHCTSDRLPGDGAVCTALGPMLARIGVTVTINAVPRAVYFPAQARGDFSLMMNGFSTPTGEGSYFLNTALHTRDPERGFGGFNHWHHSDLDLDELIRAASTELGLEERQALLEEATRQAMANMAVIPLVHLNVLWAGREEVLTFVPRVDEETLAINVQPR